MRLQMVTGLFLSAMACGLWAGCAETMDGDEEVGGETDLTTASDKADAAATEIKAHVSGLTVWIDPVARPVQRGGKQTWVIEGRASKNLDSVFSFVPDDAFATATKLSARRFEIAWDAHEMNTELSGLPLFISVTPTSGASATAALWMAPRFAQFAGSSKIYVKTAIAPVYVGGELVYRGRVSTSAPYGAIDVVNVDDSAPTVVSEGTRKWKLDWTYDLLAKAADPVTEVETFTAVGGGATVKKTAVVEMAVTQLGLTLGDPYEVWKSECDAAVHTCLGTLGGAVDTEKCGSYRQVMRCGGLPTAAPPGLDHVAADLQSFLVVWYGDHGADATGSGGNTLAAAQALVSEAKFSRVLDPEEDPNAHDLNLYFVYRHPDVVWPGSDIVWFVVYDRATGQMVDAYDFN